MTCCGIGAGDLNRLITIERKSRASDGQGGYDDTWATYATVWASMKPLGGVERWQAMRNTAENRYRVIVRWRDDGSGNAAYSAADRITFQGRTYAIDSVVPYEGKRRFIEIIAVEGKPS